MGPAAAVSAHFHPHSCKQMVRESERDGECRPLPLGHLARSGKPTTTTHQRSVLFHSYPMKLLDLSSLTGKPAHHRCFSEDPSLMPLRHHARNTFGILRRPRPALAQGNLLPRK
ncbi:hypothetical protein J6590_055254 [Homalodisca vitripennis]|nr:hypothetical protein J6590_055254 [Homalodisca vitripennis]